VRRRIRKLIVIQWVLILALLLLFGPVLYIQWKQQRAISVLIDAVYRLQQTEEQRAEPEREATPARSSDAQTY
jgi:hypothetical protein